MMLHLRAKTVKRGQGAPVAFTSATLLGQKQSGYERDLVIHFAEGQSVADKSGHVSSGKVGICILSRVMSSLSHPLFGGAVSPLVSNPTCILTLKSWCHSKYSSMILNLEILCSKHVHVRLVAEGAQTTKTEFTL